MLTEREKKMQDWKKKINRKALRDESLEVVKGLLQGGEQQEAGGRGKPCASAAEGHMRLNIGMERWNSRKVSHHWAPLTHHSPCLLPHSLSYF